MINASPHDRTISRLFQRQIIETDKVREKGVLLESAIGKLNAVLLVLGGSTFYTKFTTSLSGTSNSRH